MKNKDVNKLRKSKKRKKHYLLYPSGRFLCLVSKRPENKLPGNLPDICAFFNTNICMVSGFFFKTHFFLRVLLKKFHKRSLAKNSGFGVALSAPGCLF